MKVRDRIWRDLRNIVFYIEYLGLFVKRMNQYYRASEAFFIFISLVSVIAWNWFEGCSELWTGILLAVIGIRIMRNSFFIPQSEIASLDTMCSFYKEHKNNIEKIWFDYNSGKITDEKAERELAKHDKSET